MHSYISCLAYLAAEAERDKLFTVVAILKAASAGIYEHMRTGIEVSVERENALIDSLTAAFLFVMRQGQLSGEKQARMVRLMEEISGSRKH